jgi:hypothetical protein
MSYAGGAALTPSNTAGFGVGAVTKGDTDGSSYPNGGLRDTHAAGGCLAPDTSSPIFLLNGVTHIPSAFVSYHGKAHDEGFRGAGDGPWHPSLSPSEGSAIVPVSSTVSRAFPGGGTSVFLFSSPLLAVLAIWRLLILSDCRNSGGVCIASARTAVSAGATASIPLSTTGETMVPIPRGRGGHPKALSSSVGFDVEYAAFF